MILLIKKCVFTQQLFMVNSVLKIKEKFITCKNNLPMTLYLSLNDLFSPLLDILKASFQQI